MAIYNLVEEPWIPVQNQKLSLPDVFRRAHQLLGLASETPLIDASLLRLLVAITQRVYPSDADRVRLWRRGSFDNQVLDYLEQQRNKFDLFDNGIYRPFFQTHAYEMPGRSTSPINKLPIHQASGTTLTLIDHHLDGYSSLEFDEAARNLVTVQFFGLCGLTGYLHDPSFPASPWTYQVVALLEGRTLLETILLNYAPVAHFPYSGDDLPVWEQDDPWIDRSSPYGPLDYLTWQMRKIRLLSEDDDPCRMFMWVPGLRLPYDFADPYMLLRMARGKKPKIFPTRAADAYANWRNYLMSLLLPATRPVIISSAEHFCAQVQLSSLSVRLVGVPGENARVDGVIDITVPWSFDPAWQADRQAMLELADRGVSVAHRIAWGYAMAMAPQGDPKKQKEVAGNILDGWMIDERCWGALSADWSAVQSGVRQEYWAEVVEQTAVRELLGISVFPRSEESLAQLAERVHQELYDTAGA